MLENKTTGQNLEKLNDDSERLSRILVVIHDSERLSRILVVIHEWRHGRDLNRL